jgi:acyl-coenzyme A thioesterase PaaI-like protein
MPEETIQDHWPEEATFCWGCGKNNEHGLQLKSYWDDEETVATWEPKEHHLAFPGILNGGIIATLIDCHGTGTANAVAHKNAGDDEHHMYVTSGISIKYLRPTPLNRPVEIRGRVIANDGRKITVACELLSDGEKCVEGEVYTARVDFRKFLSARS